MLICDHLFYNKFDMFKIVFGYYFAQNVSGVTIGTNLNYTYLRNICVQYLRIL